MTNPVSPTSNLSGNPPVEKTNNRPGPGKKGKDEKGNIPRKAKEKPRAEPEEDLFPPRKHVIDVEI